MKSKFFNYQFVVNYFEKTKHYSIVRYVFEITAVAYFLKFLTIFIWVPIEGILYLLLGYIPNLGQNAPDDIDQYNTYALITFFTLVPLFETFTGQLIPMWFVSFFTKRVIIKILVSSIFFALLHVQPFLIITIFPAGVLLAWTYIIYQKKSWKHAFFVTSAVHGLHNLVALVLQYLF